MKLIVHKAFENFICLAHSVEMGDTRARCYSDTSLSLLQPHVPRQKKATFLLLTSRTYVFNSLTVF